VISIGAMPIYVWLSQVHIQYDSVMSLPMELVRGVAGVVLRALGAAMVVVVIG